jgi:hypothetical protein
MAGSTRSEQKEQRLRRLAEQHLDTIFTEYDVSREQGIEALLVVLREASDSTGRSHAAESSVLHAFEEAVEAKAKHLGEPPSAVIDRLMDHV